MGFDPSTGLRVNLTGLAFMALAACTPGTVSDALVAKPFDAVVSDTTLELSATPSFADERGGGLFIDLAGRVVRVRADGTRGQIESHPANPVTPGPATAIHALGPYSGLVSTAKGLFVAESGWLIAPPWQSLLPAEGLVATAIADNGVGWLAHERGLFRLEAGQLTELKVNGESIGGLTAMGVAPATDGSTGVWYAQGDVVSSASQTSKLDFVIRSSALSKKDLAGGVIGMAGIAPAPNSPGELWAITPKLLFQFTAAEGWRKFELGRAPKQMISAGRVAWLQSGDDVYRYDADVKTWGRTQRFESVPTLLAVDATGAAWARIDQLTSSISASPPIRVDGVFQNAKVYDAELVIQAVFATATPVSTLSFSFDDGALREVDVTHGQPGTGPQAAMTFFSLGGNEANGLAKGVSLAALGDGLHTLNLTASLVGGGLTSRQLHFELHASATAVLSWAADIDPISTSRCAKCHTTGTMPELKTLEQWKANSQLILDAVRDRRMPADGPLDPAGIQAIARWVNGGMLP